MIAEAQNMITGHNSLGTVENELSITKLENWTNQPQISVKMSYEAQNVQNRRTSLGTIESECESTKRENQTQ
jgi:hypothetical protein